MDRVITIYDWWDGPLRGLATYKEFICIYERIFDEGKDDWSNEYYLTPINEDTVNLLLKDWAAWCETIRNKAGIANRSPVGRDVYHKTAELSAHKRAYRRTAAFYGCFDRGFVPIDYQVEWTEG